MNYLDTSSFVKYYRFEADEKGAERVIRLIDNAKEGNATLISSFLLVGECVSVFDKWVRYKFISPEESNRIIKKFIMDIQELSNNGMLILEPVSTSTITNCLDLIIKHHLSINDAIHLYAALSNKSLIEQFICSDELLLKAAKSEGFLILNPEDKSERK